MKYKQCKYLLNFNFTRNVHFYVLKQANTLIVLIFSLRIIYNRYRDKTPLLARLNFRLLHPEPGTSETPCFAKVNPNFLTIFLSAHSCACF